MSDPTHEKLLSVLVAEDQRLSKRERIPNIYRIGHYLKALEDAEEHDGIIPGILDSFCHSRLRDKLLKAAGQAPCKCGRPNSCRLCSD